MLQIVWLILISFRCFANDPFLPSSPPERQFSHSADEHLIGGFVNPATGQFSLSVIDLVAEGVQPLTLQRHYYPPRIKEKYSKNKKEDDFMLGQVLSQHFGWIFFPHILATVEKLKKGSLITITEPDGSMIYFKQHRDGTITLESKGPFTNSNGQTISSTYDSRNTRCSFKSDQITVYGKDGATRYYEKGPSSQFFLKKERLPNGKIIIYSYNNDYFLTSIESKDPHERFTYATLTRIGHDWVTHTGQKACYEFSTLSKKGNLIKVLPPGYLTYNYTHYFLSKIISPLSNESYGYNWRGILCWNSDTFSSTYFPIEETFQISNLQLPVGNNDAIIPTHHIKYDTKNHITSVFYPDDTTTFYHFSKENFLQSLSHGQKTTSYTWNHNNHLSAIEVHDLYRIDYESDSFGNLIEETFTGDDVYTIYREYNRNLLVREEADAVTTYTYLENTNLITSKTTDGLEERYAYDDCNNLIETFINGRTTHYIRRQNHPHLHCIEWIEKEDRKIHLHYDQYGNISQEDHYDANEKFAYSIYKEYNARGQVTLEINPIGQKFSYTYDKDGRLTSSSKTKEKMQYDLRGRLIKHSDPFYTTTYKYDTSDNLIEKTDRFGTTYYTYHDKCLIKTIHEDQVTTSSYDIYGREISKTDANGHTTYFQYNARNQPIKISYPDGSYESSDYYPNGRLKAHTDIDGNTISYTYDTLGRVTSKIYEGQGEEIFTYDLLHLLSQTDLEGHITTYTYDTLGRKIKEERCDRVTTYSYDPLGRIASTTKGGITTHYTYDLLDRVIEESTPYSQISYTYDENGNKSSITKGDSQESYIYDALNRLVKQTDPLGNKTTITYTDFQKITTDPNGTTTIETYDIYENLLSKEIPNVTKFQYTYDLANNLIQLEEDVYKNGNYSKTLTTTYTYTQTNKLASITRGGETTQYIYAPSRKTKIKPDGTAINYTYDFLGNCTTAGSDIFIYNKLGHLIEGTGFIREVDPFGNILKESLSNGLTIEKTYDDLNRPLTTIIPTGTITYTYDLYLKTISYKGYTHTYTYNPSGHITQSGYTHYTRDPKGQIIEFSAPHIAQECTYDPLGNLTFATPNTYTYDALSQLTEDFDSHFDLPNVPETGNLTLHNNQTLLYDEHDRLIQAGSTIFTYDALGRRLSKDDEIYLYDNLEEIATNTSCTKIHNVLIELNNKLTIPIFDATHTLRYLIDPETTQILNSYEFDPFGNPLTISETLPNPYRYALKHYDKETNLIYFGKRYYNPEKRRWITPDPLGPIDHINLYTFVRNNPFRYTDYTGLFSSAIESSYTYQRTKQIFLTTLENPRFQGSMQAIAGLAEVSAGSALAATPLAPLGIAMLAHGSDHFTAGSYALITGRLRNTATSELLHRFGLSFQNANFIDNNLNMLGIMGASAIIQRARTLSPFSNHLKSPEIHTTITTVNEKIKFNFTNTAGKHMHQGGRKIPIQILDEIIKSPVAMTNDPHGVLNAKMYYSQMYKNEKLYNVEVLYDETKNIISHFKYTPDSLGPLKEIK